MNEHDIKLFTLPGHPTSQQRRLLKRHLRRELRIGHGQCFLDFSKRAVLDSEDIELALVCAEVAMKKDSRFGVIAGSSSNRVILEITRIDSVVSVFQSLDETVFRVSSNPTDRSSHAYSTTGGTDDFYLPPM